MNSKKQNTEKVFSKMRKDSLEDWLSRPFQKEHQMNNCENQYRSLKTQQILAEFLQECNELDVAVPPTLLRSLIHVLFRDDKYRRNTNNQNMKRPATWQEVFECQ